MSIVPNASGNIEIEDFPVFELVQGVVKLFLSGLMVASELSSFLGHMKDHMIQAAPVPLGRTAGLRPRGVALLDLSTGMVLGKTSRAGAIAHLQGRKRRAIVRTRIVEKIHHDVHDYGHHS